MKITTVVAILSLSSIAVAQPAERVPIRPASYVIGDSMDSAKVMALAVEEYAALDAYVAEYGEQPGTAELRATADAHFAEGVRRLAAEVKAALDPETPEEAFKREVEQLGKDVAAILETGTLETPEEAFRREVEALAAEVAETLSGGTIGPDSRPTGNNGARYAPSNGGTSSGTRGGRKPFGGAIGAGMLRD